MNPIRIADRDDPRLAAYLDIRERDLVGREGRFVAEGKVVLNVLFSSRRFEAESVMLRENRVAGMADTLLQAPREMPVYVVPGDVMDAVAGFHLHRGVLGIGRKREPETPDALLRGLGRRALVVACVGIANHDNIGAIFRNAAAFGADAVLLDATCCDPLYRKAIRVSVGAALQVPFATAPSTALVEACSAHGFEAVALSPRGALALHAVPRPDRLALFMGAEGEGLPIEMLGRMTTARIAMAGRLDSLNVAAASAIALHHFADRLD